MPAAVQTQHPSPQLSPNSTRLASSAPVAVQTQRAAGGTVGRVRYFSPPPRVGEELYLHVYGQPEDGSPATNIKPDEHEVEVTDLRAHAADFSLATNGMELHRFEVPADINWQDEAEVQQRYYPLAEAKLREVTGATRVHIFDHTLRSGQLSPEPLGEYNAAQRGKPVPMAHVDYTAAGGLRRLHMLLPDEAERLQRTPFAIVQVWRPTKGPVQSSPLGVIDADTVDKEDLMSYRLEFPGRTGYNYGVRHNPKHRWYFAPGMETNEAYVFVCFDSRADRARFTPHTGFWDVGTPADAPQRESVELRSICFFEDLPSQPVATEL